MYNSISRSGAEEPGNEARLAPFITLHLHGSWESSDLLVFLRKKIREFWRCAVLVALQFWKQGLGIRVGWQKLLIVID